MLQCLAQTPFLRQVLLDSSESGEPVTIKLDNEDIVSICLHNYIILLLFTYKIIFLNVTCIV